MNSFRFIERGIHAELARQVDLRRARRGGRAGDAALRPRHGRAPLAAQQGGGARLPLLPRAGPRARSRSSNAHVERVRADMTELPLARMERFEHQLLALQLRRRGAQHRRGDGRLLRGGSGCRDDADAKLVANWTMGELLALQKDGAHRHARAARRRRRPGRCEDDQRRRREGAARPTCRRRRRRSRDRRARRPRPGQ